MNIYVDFDDILCETAKGFVSMVDRMFDIQVPYEDVEFFDLQKSFKLSDKEYVDMMIEGHIPENLLALEETEGASDVINEWIDAGHKVFIITGRPYSAYGPSRQWLDEHNLSRVELFCLNKYGRDTFLKGSSFSLELEDFYKMPFDFAVEDSPNAFKHLAHLPECTVAVYNRPWNRAAELPSEKYVRCPDWQAISDLFDKMKN